MRARTATSYLRVWTRSVRTQAQFFSHKEPDAELHHRTPGWDFNLANPRQLVEYLDGYVVGQMQAKKVLSVAVFNHYNRVRANIAPPPPPTFEEVPPEEWVDLGSTATYSRKQLPVTLQPHPIRRSSFASQTLHFPQPIFEKSNVLVIGPTGSGKTLLARTLAKVLDVPFSVSDATTFTQAGYVGEDVEMCIHRLLQSANWDAHRASTGIVYIDEADKLARRGNGDTSSRDVGGEGVQQSLLRMIEGSVVTVNGKDAGTPPGSGSTRSQSSPGPKQESYQLDTSNVLFILSGAFVGLDKVVKRRVAKGSIGFTAPLATQSVSDQASDFVPFFTPNGKAANIWDLVEPADLIQFGYIPEFVSRLPSITSLQPLTMADLLRILTEVKGSLVSQYTALFGYSGVEIRFTTPCLREICRLAKERGGGARGLRGIMETLLLEPMYEVPGSSIRYVLITEAVVKGERSAMYWSRGEGAVFWSEWANEEQRDTKLQESVLAS